MTTLFLDTNIIIDFLSNRQPFANEASQLFEASIQKKIKLYISAISVNNIYYILRQQLHHSQCLKMLSALTEWTFILDTTKEIINLSLHSDFKDFEDAIQYHSALSKSNIQCIVTRNTKDYKKSKLPILTPGEAIQLLNLN